MSFELSRDVPCSDEDCATVLGWPEAPICPDCADALEQQGIATEDVQLTLDDEEEAA